MSILEVHFVHVAVGYLQATKVNTRRRRDALQTKTVWSGSRLSNMHFFIYYTSIKLYQTNHGGWTKIIYSLNMKIGLEWFKHLIFM
jgi:hypothetical protein